MENKEELIKFIQWLPENVEEFKGKSPEEISNALNELGQSEEGINILKQLFTKFKKSSQMFKKGGKIDNLVKKYATGGPNKRPYEAPDVLDDGLNNYYTRDEYGDYRDVNGNIVDIDTPELRREQREWNDYASKHTTRSFGNTSYTQVVSPDGQDTVYWKTYGFQKPRKSKNGFMAQAYYAFPKLFDFIGYKPNYIEDDKKFKSK